MRRLLAALMILACCWSIAAQEPAAKLKTAVIQWVADAPQLTYDVRYTGGDSTTMPTAFKYLLKDLALSEGWYLTGEDKSKTVASQAKRISLEFTQAKSKVKGVRVAKVEVKELPGGVGCAVTFAKKPGADDVTRTGSVLEPFARKYLKVAKSVPSAVEKSEGAKATVWNYEVRFKEAAKAK